MSSLGPDHLRPMPQQGEDWGPGYPAPTGGSGGTPWGLLVTGLVVVGLGAMAWNYLGPDLRRYIKISNM